MSRPRKLSLPDRSLFSSTSPHPLSPSPESFGVVRFLFGSVVDWSVDLQYQSELMTIEVDYKSSTAMLATELYTEDPSVT